jgi:manganese transport protein
VLEKDAAVRAASRRRLALLGPAFVAAIAYVDPGNFATNVTGGARFGYLLLWGDHRGQPRGDARAVSHRV